jgi:S1-C subfamily serine protease
MSGLDLESIGRSVVKLRADVPEDAFTAGILGSQRTGNGVVIDSKGLILTIGYLVTEATDVWLTTADGRELVGHPLAYDQVTGFGLVLPLEKADIAPIPLGSSAQLKPGDQAYVVSSPEFAEPQPVEILARREFAGAWEYLLEDAIFATPAHPHWSGSALIDGQGSLVGLGSLLVRELTAGEEINANMFVPIDLLKPILEELITREGGPAQLADIREGDLIMRVAEHDVATLPDFYRRLWAVGPAGTGVPLTAIRGGTRLHVNVRSVDRVDLLKRPQAH